MTAENVNAWAQLVDALYAMGFSAIVWLLYHLLIILLPMRNKVLAYVVHIVFFAVAGLYAFCFVVGQTSLGVVRWYLAAGFGAGAAAYWLYFAPAVNRAADAVRAALRWLAKPFVRLWGFAVVRPVGIVCARLQKRRALRYNQRVERKRAREQARHKKEEQKNAEPATGKKEPIQAYTQT